MSELKPCPFCGKKPNPNWTDESYIECTNRKCSVYGYGMSTGDWNTRPIEDELRKRIAELEAAQRWRVVADGELPELDQDVFAVVEGEIKVGHFYQELDFIEPDDDDEEGNIYFSVFDDGLLVATHWFPIPDGLEEREK